MPLTMIIWYINYAEERASFKIEFWQQTLKATFLVGFLKFETIWSTIPSPLTCLYKHNNSCERYHKLQLQFENRQNLKFGKDKSI